jgi:uncharacterized protein YqeY
MKKTKTNNEVVKESLQKLMKNAMNLKNLSAPETEEQVKDLDNLKESMVELDDYLTQILTVIDKLKEHEDSFDKYMEGERKDIAAKNNKRDGNI